jgi:lysophospholipase L1-like esterase
MKRWFLFVLICIVCVEFFGAAWFGYQAWMYKKNTGTVVPIDRSFFVSSPSSSLAYFYESRPSSRQEDYPAWLTEKAVYTISEDFLNERYTYTKQKPKNVFRILTLGDSFTFGHFVNTEDNWTEKIEDLLSARCVDKDIDAKIEVINLGERGYDVAYIAHRFAKRGAQYSPDLIIWLESGSGFERVKEVYEPLIQKYQDALTVREIDEAEKAKDYALAWTKAKEEVQRLYSTDQLEEKIYAAWSAFFQEKGDTNLVIATFSVIPEQNKTNLTQWTQNARNTSLYFDIQDIWSMGGVLPDGHPSSIGHDIIANDLLTYLIENKHVPCPIL